MKDKRNMRAGKAGGLWARLKAQREESGKRDDPGFTIHEYIAAFGVSRRVAQYELDDMVGRGALIKGSAVRPAGSGIRRRCAVYLEAGKR